MEQYSHLWDGSSPEWALLATTSSERENLHKLAIYNRNTRSVLLIEDENIYLKVKEAMLAAGVKVLTVQDIREEQDAGKPRPAA